MPSILKSRFLRSRKCEWIFIVFMVTLLLTIATLTIVLVVQEKEAVADKLEKEKGPLRSLHILFRHGARTPTDLPPDDPYYNFSWPEGLGGLTVHGKERMYEYGQTLYGRYKRYIDVAPVRSIIAESSPVRRFGKQFKWPAWMEAVGSDCLPKMKEFHDFAFNMEGPLGVPYFRLRAGTFLKTLIQRLNATVHLKAVDQSTRQLNVYGTHDIMLAWILQALGFPRGQPNFGDGIIVELRAHPQTQTPMVHLYYSSLTAGVGLYELPLNQSATFKGKCGGVACPFADFADSLQDYLPEHIEEECGAKWT